MNSCKIVSNEEYTKLTNTLHFFETTRNSLLTFSFTAVLAVLGVAIGMDNTDVNPLVYLLPFFLIVPFTARISYYRLASAHINTFLKIFAPERMVYPIGSGIVHERHGTFYGLIAWLVNHEMVLLSCVPTFTLWFKYSMQLTEWTIWDKLLTFAPIALTVLVFLISNSTYSYKRLNDVYTPKWNSYYRNFNCTQQKVEQREWLS